MHIVKSLYSWFLTFLELQLFITICSLPIFMYWGLPISLMTVVGNFIFSPLLTVFIFLATLIFFTELFLIPNGVLIQFLDTITNLWLSILAYGDKAWLIGLKQDYVLLSLLPFISAFIIVKSRIKREYKVIALCILTCSTTLFLHSFPTTTDTVVAIPHGKKSGMIVIQDQTVTFIDHGLFSKRSARSCIKYTLLPALLKKTGNATIDTLQLTSICRTTLENLIFAETLLPIKAIRCTKKITNPYLKTRLQQFCFLHNIQVSLP